VTLLPDRNADPAVEAIAAAWAMTVGSWYACFASTSCKTVRSFGFSVKEAEVGGSSLVVPTTTSGLADSVGNNDSI
jgi:hypothetical protein